MKKVYLFDVNVLQHCTHYQALYKSKLLAENARTRYLNDPSCESELMQTNIIELEINENLKNLDWIKEARDTLFGDV